MADGSSGAAPCIAGQQIGWIICVARYEADQVCLDIAASPPGVEAGQEAGQKLAGNWSEAIGFTWTLRLSRLEWPSVPAAVMSLQRCTRL